MKFLDFKKYILISRPIIFPLIFLCFLVALSFSTKNICLINYTHLIFILLLTFLLPFFTFSINDLEDFNSDKINQRKKSIIFGKFIPNLLSYKKSIDLYNFIIFIILLSYSLFFFNVYTSLVLFFLLFIIYFYSAKPLRLKEILFLDSVSNGLVAFLSFLLIFLIFNNLSQLPFKIIAVSISIMSYHLIAAQIDVLSDKKTKHKTTATIINNKYLVLILIIIYNIPLLFVTFNSFFKYLIFFNLGLIFLVYLNYKKIWKLILVFFLIGWIIITLTYIFKSLF